MPSASTTTAHCIPKKILDDYGGRVLNVNDQVIADKAPSDDLPDQSDLALEALIQ